MGELERYLQVIAGGGQVGPLIEIRYRGDRGMVQIFRDVREPQRAASVIRDLAPRRDVYVGVLTRDREAGGRDAVSRAHLVWVEVDAQAAERLLQRAPQAPTMTIASGSPGHVHAYWLLRKPVGPDAAQSANRKLALRVGGDLASVDAARILRPPETFNHKHSPPRAVRLLTLELSRSYDLERLVAGLEDPRPQARESAGRALEGEPASRHRPRREEALYEQLREIPAAQYVQRLTGHTPDREGKVLCFFHEERKPSLQCYEDGSFCCFGCGRGGSIVDFAAALWGLETKGRDFLRVRDRLAAELLGGRAAHSAVPAARRIAPQQATNNSNEIAR